MQKWISEKVYLDVESFFKAIDQDCESASHNISMEFYIFCDDEIGRLVSASLKKAAQDGKLVRLIVDGFGSREWILSHAEELEKSGVHVRIFNPFFFAVFPSSLRNLRLFMKWFPYIVGINRRTHRKFCLIDDDTAWVGSQNAFLPPEPAPDPKNPWREVGVRVEGDISKFNETFENIWERCWSFDSTHSRSKRVANNIKVTYTRLIRLNDTVYRRYAYKKRLLTFLKGSQQRIWIANAYFVPSSALVRALVRARRRGVDVRVIAQGPSDSPIAHKISTALYYPLLKGGVRIFEYQPKVLHSKTILLDEVASVGTSNLNYRSLLHDLEVDVVVNQENTILKLEEIFLKDQNDSQEITLAYMNGKPWYFWVLTRIALLFKFMA